MDNHKTIQVAALTGGVKTPSARFRVRQYVDRLAHRGICVREQIPFFQKSCGWPSPFKAAARIPALFRSRDADLIWLNKELVQGYPTFERLLKRPRVLDADDFCDLKWTNEFADRVSRYSLTSTNDIWKTTLDDTQQQDLQEALGTYLARYNYASF